MLYNLVDSKGKVLFEQLTEDEAKAKSAELQADGQKAPQVVPVGQDEIGIVGSTAFAEMTSYCIRHFRAQNPNRPIRDKDGNDLNNPLHWSAVAKMALRGFDLSAGQVKFITDLHSKVEASVAWRRSRNQRYPLVEFEKLEDLDWSI